MEWKNKCKITVLRFENLEAEEIIREAEDKVCPECGSEMEIIGKEFVRDELVYAPARMFVIKDKYCK